MLLILSQSLGVMTTFFLLSNFKWVVNIQFKKVNVWCSDSVIHHIQRSCVRIPLVEVNTDFHNLFFQCKYLCEQAVIENSKCKVVRTVSTSLVEIIQCSSSAHSYAQSHTRNLFPVSSLLSVMNVFNAFHYRENYLLVTRVDQYMYGI